MNTEALDLDFGQLLSVPRSAQSVGLSARTLWKWIASGRLEHVRLGRRVLIPSRSLEALVAAATRKAAAAEATSGTQPRPRAGAAPSGGRTNDREP